MRILIITDYLPYPLICGDRLRVYHLARRIAREHQVVLAGFLQSPAEAEGISHLDTFCDQVAAVNLLHRSKLARAPGIVRYAMTGKPLDFEFLDSPLLAARIQEVARTSDFDIVQIEHSRMAPYVEALPHNAKAKRVLVFHNAAFTQYERIARIALTPVQRARSWLHGAQLRRWEPRYAERFDRCIAVSDLDRELLQGANPRLQVEVVPNGVDTRVLQPLPAPESMPALLLVGNMSYAPCADGALWFVHEILPRVRQLVGDVEVWIVGISPPPQVTRLNGDRVHVTGRVDDLLPYYKRSAVAIVPLRAGGGTRLKILEAMALARPVVSTSIGCEGLEISDGEHLLIADEPEEFAQRTVRLIEDHALYRRISNAARHRVEEAYDWDTIAAQLLGIYDELTE